jgi:hypothetical protein
MRRRRGCPRLGVCVGVGVGLSGLEWVAQRSLELAGQRRTPCKHLRHALGRLAGAVAIAAEVVVCKATRSLGSGLH